MKNIGYVGTYTTNRSEGIYRFYMKDQELLDVSLFKEIKNPKYICYVKDYIACVNEFEHGAGLSVFRQDGTLVDSLLFEKTASCYVMYDHGIFYAANFHEGRVTIIRFFNDRLEFVKVIEIGEGAGCHEVILYKNLILIPCLKLNRIEVYDQTYKYVRSIEFPDGVGCRHGVVSDDLKYLYVVGELNNHLYVIDLDSFEIVNDVLLLDGKENVEGSAAIRLVGSYLYVSTRFEDVISVLEVKGKDVVLKQVNTCFGHHPRDFVVFNDTLIVANRDSDSLVSISLRDGLLQEKINEVLVPEGISIIVKED